jgi:hypothetical protein
VHCFPPLAGGVCASCGAPCGGRGVRCEQAAVRTGSNTGRMVKAGLTGWSTGGVVQGAGLTCAGPRVPGCVYMTYVYSQPPHHTGSTHTAAAVGVACCAAGGGQYNTVQYRTARPSNTWTTPVVVNNRCARTAPAEAPRGLSGAAEELLSPVKVLAELRVSCAVGREPVLST